jgi:hypothetical protein
MSNLKDLYECWVFCKILYGIAQKYDIRFKEIHLSKGVAECKMKTPTLVMRFLHYLLPFVSMDLPWLVLPYCETIHPSR